MHLERSRGTSAVFGDGAKSLADDQRRAERIREEPRVLPVLLD